MKAFFVSFVLMFCFLSCTKVDISEVARQRLRLSGSGNPGDVFHTWVLDSAYKDGKPLSLTPFQKKYKKVYFFDRTYKDSDLNEGRWDITEINKLKQYTYIKSKTDSIIYDILTINAFSLTIKTTNGNSSLVYYFQITN